MIVQLGANAQEIPSAQRRPPRARRAAIWARIQHARKPVLMIGQGCAAAAQTDARLSRAHRDPGVQQRLRPGIVSEQSPWCLGYDSLRGSTAQLNALLEEADLVIAVGTRLAYNGTGGFELALPPQRLVHVDASAASLNAVYPAAACAVLRAEDFFGMPQSQGSRAHAMERGGAGTLARAHRRGVHDRTPEPVIAGATPQEFFATLRAQLPDEAMLVTDSGLHQVMARRYFQVRQPFGLLLPTDLQSMGFGLPSALAARLAAPSRPVVALMGDGGMLMSGLELATAVREQIDLTVIVFNDGYLNQIRMQQLGDAGRDHGVTLPVIDFQALGGHGRGRVPVLCARGRGRAGACGAPLGRDAHRGAGER